MIPGDTAFTRAPVPAYSTASERVAASRPPFVSEARTDGTALSAWSTSDVVMVRTWPAPRSSIGATARPVMAKNPARFSPDHRGEVVVGVGGERLGEEHPRVVGQRVDPAEALQGRVHHARRGLRVGEVARTVCTWGSSEVGRERDVATTA